MATGTISKYMDGTDTGWITMQSSQHPNIIFTRDDSAVRYRKIGNIVEISVGPWFKMNKDVDPTQGEESETAYYRTLFTMPVGYRPKYATMASCYINSGGVNVRIVAVKCNDSGDIVLYSNPSTIDKGNRIVGGESGTNLSLSAMYFTD